MPSVYPEGAVQKLVALLLEVYGDEWLLLPAMHYRWTYNLDYILEEFGKMAAPDASGQEQRAIGERISAPFRGSLPFLGVNEATVPAIESWYEEFLKQLNVHLADYPYLFGSRPSIGDYGLMGPLYAHNYRDPASGNLMRRIAPDVTRWVDLMNTPAPNSGHFLADDGVPDTLLPILTRMFADCIPTMVSTVHENARWLENNPDVEELPRSVGQHTIRIGDVTSTCAVRTFSQWMFQRPLAHYHSLKGDDRARADELLARAGGVEAMQTEITHPVARRNYKLVRA